MHRLVRITLTICIVFAAVLAVGLSKPHSAHAANASYHGTLSYATNQIDIYALVMKAGQTVNLYMICDADNMDPYLELYDALGNFIDYSDDDYPSGADNPCDYSSWIIFTAPVDGNYVLNVTTYDAINGYSDRGFGTGGYTVIASGSFVAFGPTINNVPNLGLIKLDTGQAQPAYDAPAGGVMRGSNGAEVWLPADADHSGYDTYVVTDAVEVDGEIWVAVWVGGEAYGWLPLAGVTPLTQLAID